jgi:hypothetical protein
MVRRVFNACLDRTRRSDKESERRRRFFTTSLCPTLSFMRMPSPVIYRRLRGEGVRGGGKNIQCPLYQDVGPQIVAVSLSWLLAECRVCKGRVHFVPDHVHSDGIYHYISSLLPYRASKRSKSYDISSSITSPELSAISRVLVEQFF